MSKITKDSGAPSGDLKFSVGMQSFEVSDGGSIEVSDPVVIDYARASKVLRVIDGEVTATEEVSEPEERLSLPLEVLTPLETENTNDAQDAAGSSAVEVVDTTVGINRRKK